MMGLALMAAEIACRRAYGYHEKARDWMAIKGVIQHAPREYSIGPATAEYYRIIDRLARGERP